jgi:hypothetical protein
MSNSVKGWQADLMPLLNRKQQVTEGQSSMMRYRLPKLTNLDELPLAHK